MTRSRVVWPVAAALLLAVAAATGCAPSQEPITIGIKYSAYDPTELTVPVGVPVTFVLDNGDPIDHEWMVGDEAFHEKHRTGTHASHDSVPTEVSIPALESVSTTITFDEPGTFSFICHLPKHESYGMVGVLTVED